MNTRRLLADATARLELAGVASARADAEWLLAHVTGRTRTALMLIDEVEEPAAAAFDALLERRAGREPVQHLTGTAPFGDLELVVGTGVFVPRPETEQLAEWGVATVSRAALPAPVVVDLCTGSGAIAAWIAHQVPGARVHAVELDEGAYAYAERNLAAFDVDLRLGDAMHAFPELDASVDLVLANPPYIPLSAWEGVEQEVRDWDPALALWSGEDGLDTIRVVEQVARRLLKPGGAVGCEHADAQREAAPKVFAATGGWTDVRDHRDLADRPRFVAAVRRGA